MCWRDASALLLLLCTGAMSQQQPATQAELHREGEYTDLTIYADSDVQYLARTSCRDSVFESCVELTEAAIQLEKNKQFGHLLVNWKYNEICGFPMMQHFDFLVISYEHILIRCYMPPRRKKEMLQFMHIPKTGTSFNYLLHDYFGCLSLENNTDGCVQWLDRANKLSDGLCGGRLFSCQGHRTHRDLPDRVFQSMSTSLVTLLRDPWSRVISDYNYILSKPTTRHLSPEQNLTNLFPTDVFSYVMTPGINNCATKMLNGFQCGEVVDLTNDHLDIAKQVISKILFVGLTENFKQSLCLFTWMYGGEVAPVHLTKTRQTAYRTSKNIKDVLSPHQRSMFKTAYRYDIELYSFARELFDNRYQLTGCTA